MVFDDYLRFLVSLVTVLALIVATGWVLRRLSSVGVGIGKPGQRRLAVIESLPLDSRRRLVLIRRDGTEHLLLLGGTTDKVVESGIATAGPAAGEVTVQALGVPAGISGGVAGA